MSDGDRNQRVALRAGRHAEQRQDRAVQRADRQPAEGRELSGRHGRAQGRHAADARPATRVNLVDLPGTYSLRGRSPDEEITRDVVLGRLASESAPDLLLCVADATNLRVALRLVIELKRVGRPMLLVLNMIDIARRRGIDIDLDKLSAELGVPVVTSTAVRRGGTEDLLRRIDEMAASAAGKSVESTWQPPTTSDLRAAQREADRVIKAAVGEPSRPDTMTGRVDAVLLHPVAGLLILLAAAVRHVPGGVRLGEAADGPDRGGLRLARRARA